MGKEREPLKKLGPYKKGELVPGMQLPLKPEHLEMLNNWLDFVEKKIGKDNIETVYLVGGAQRMVQGTDARGYYSDADVCVVTKDQASAEKLKEMVAEIDVFVPTKTRSRQLAIKGASKTEPGSRPVGQWGLDVAIYAKDKVLRRLDPVGEEKKLIGKRVLPLISGIPIYNRDAGLKLQIKMRRVSADVLGERGYQRVYRDWRKALKKEKGGPVWKTPKGKAKRARGRR